MQNVKFTLAIAALALAATTQPTRANWAMHKVFDFSGGYPGTGDNIIASGLFPTIHDDIVMFGISSGAGGNAGIFRYERGALGSFAETPGDPILTSISIGSAVAHNPYTLFSGNSASGSGIYTRSIDNTKTVFPIATNGTPIPGGTGNFTLFGDKSIDAQHVTFDGVGSGGHRGIYVSKVNSNLPSLVVEKLESFPVLTDTFQSFGHVSHRGDTVVFSGTGTTHNGIFSRNIVGPPGAIGLIANTDTTIPDQAVKFTLLASPSYDGTDTAFYGEAPGVSGIYTNHASPLRTVADNNTPIPEGAGNFTSFERNSISIDAGTIFFQADNGIYAEQDGELQKVVTTGDVIDGRTVTSVDLGRHGFNTGRAAIRLQFDDFGSAFYAAFTQQHWDPPTGAGGNWDDPANWPLGVTSFAGIDTFVQPDGPAIIQGPTTTTHTGSLTIGSLSTGTSELHIQPTGQIFVGATLTIQSSGKLTGNGAIFVDDVLENSGEIDLGNDSLSLAGNTFDNFSLLRGNGQVANKTTNFATGEIRVTSGDTIRFTGPSTTNHGQIRLINGGIVEFTNPITNAVTGSITGRGAIIADAGLTNAGTMQFSGGFTDIYGDVALAVGSTTRIAGGGTTTFYNDVINDGTINVDSGSRVVFFGATSGTGTFPGTGEVVIEGTFSPGHSPGTIYMSHDLTLTESATLILELAGHTPGKDHDQLNISHTLNAAGTLTIALLGNYRPAAGQTFQLLNFTEASGVFTAINLPALHPALSFDTSSLLTTGTLTVIPEPTTLAVLATLTLLVTHNRKGEK